MTTSNPNYKEIEALLRTWQPFEHADSMSALWADGVYNVYSYTTLIATYSFVEWVDTPAGWWLNDTKYSRTTSKQQSILRRVIAEYNLHAPSRAMVNA
jgi:hypothetical protein